MHMLTIVVVISCQGGKLGNKAVRRWQTTLRSVQILLHLWAKLRIEHPKQIAALCRLMMEKHFALPVPAIFSLWQSLFPDPRYVCMETALVQSSPASSKCQHDHVYIYAMPVPLHMCQLPMPIKAKQIYIYIQQMWTDHYFMVHQPHAMATLQSPTETDSCDLAPSKSLTKMVFLLLHEMCMLLFQV